MVLCMDERDYATFSKYVRLVFERDKGVCQVCGYNGLRYCKGIAYEGRCLYAESIGISFFALAT